MSQRNACKDFEQDLVLYHYGDCVGADKQRVESHLDGCDGCRQFLQELKAFLPATLAVDEPPPSFWQDYSREMRIKLTAADEKPSWIRSLAAIFRPWPVPALAAGAIIAIGLTMTIGHMRSSTETSSAPEQYTEMASNADFFRSLDLLDSMDFLESVESQETQKGETGPQNL
ncbi:MAG TPA: zf-HC2 domain-containing protein [Candidatus Binatia bacterium]|jgi:predicted anti-sigma-YlaC factor YlaD